MKARTLAGAAVAALSMAVLAAGCSATSGTVTSYTYTPPSDQSVNLSCSQWSGSGSKYGSSQTCLGWNTAVEPAPQDCRLTFTSADKTGHYDLDVNEEQCRSYLGRQWPLSGTSQATPK